MFGLCGMLGCNGIMTSAFVAKGLCEIMRAETVERNLSVHDLALVCVCVCACVCVCVGVCVCACVSVCVYHL